MKRILSLAIALIALFGFNVASAQNPHFVQGPCVNASGQVSGKIAGLGNNQDITITINGTAECAQKNNGDHVVNDFSKTFRARTDKNGNYNLSTDLRPCPGGFNLVSAQSATVCVYSGTTASGTPLFCATTSPCN